MSTLDQVLEDVAQRSFYEDSAVQLTESGGYHIEDTNAGDDMAPDGVQWTYEAGLGATEHRTWSEDSGLMEPCMFFETAGHIRYNLPNAVEALEAGKLVEFSYQVVDAGCTCSDNCGDIEAIGWTLLARIYED